MPWISEKKTQRQKHLTRHQMPSAPETQFLLINLSFNPSVSCFTPSLSRSLPLSQNSPMLNCFFFFVSFNCPSSFLRSPFFFPSRAQVLRVTGNADYNGERNARVVLVCGGETKKMEWKKNNGGTGEGLRREMSKCLFMPNWATDEPAAISDNGPSGRKG